MPLGVGEGSSHSGAGLASQDLSADRALVPDVHGRVPQPWDGGHQRVRGWMRSPLRPAIQLHHRGYPRGMPKVSVYLSDELYRAARERGLPISALAQQAIENALRGDRTQRWIDAARRRPPRSTGGMDVSGLLRDVRDEFGW